MLFAFLAAAAMFLLARQQGRSAERQGLVKMMELPAEVEGENAFAAVWLLGYDVPAGRIEAAAADDVQRFERNVAALEGDETVENFASGASTDYPVLVPKGGRDDAWCDFDQDCLAHVRRHREPLAGQEARLQAMHAQVAALAEYGYYRNAFPPRVDAPFPAHLASVPRAALTWAALQYDRGDVEAGLDAVCEVASAWRPLVANSDSLVVSMVAERVHDGASRLFAAMLARDRRAAITDSCRVAFAAPDVGEASVCEAMKGEFRLVSGHLMTDGSLGGEPLPWHAFFTYDAEASRGRLARFHARACDEHASRRLSQDEAFTRAPLADGFETECVANVLGCILTSIAAPAYDDYHRRGQDHLMRMRLMATLLWLRSSESDPLPLEARLALRPAALRSPGRELQPGGDGRTLGFRLYSNRGPATWQVPVSQ
ncbi:hypothetical protein [Marilutibacter aestuarii]|uniref:Uncharacterized protein n=1 Tax=Marilutibacter aestuarii TaxID=1706195 RepID=A0A508A902_9GAMM|nr:hypothetical protein [Lysobacter aestuarii]TQD43505.1 hypothetical protein FKV25_10400 [Lysobacter aestuarii]